MLDSFKSQIKTIKFIINNRKAIRDGKFSYPKMTELKTKLDRITINLAMIIGTFLVLGLIAWPFSSHVIAPTFLVLAMLPLFLILFLGALRDDLEYTTIEISKDLLNIIDIKTRSLYTNEIDFKKIKYDLEDIKTRFLSMETNTQLPEITKMSANFYEISERFKRLIVLSDEPTFRKLKQETIRLAKAYQTMHFKTIIQAYAAFDLRFRKLYKEYFNEEIRSGSIEAAETMRRIWLFFSSTKTSIMLRNIILLIIALGLLVSILIGKFPFGLTI